MIFKLLIITLLIFILYTLGSALFALMRSGNDSGDRVVKALTLRIALSLGLFILLMLGYAAGLITPNTAMTDSDRKEVQSSPQ